MPRTARPDEINGSAFDRFTLVHFGVGIAIRSLGMPFWAAAVASAGWEALEDRLKDRVPQLFPHASHDRPINAATDMVAMTLGWCAGDTLLNQTRMKP